MWFNFIDIIGYVAGIFIMFSFIPQVIKSYKTKKVEDISLLMIILTLIGTIFWEIYGFLANSKPIIIMNGLFGITAIYQLYLKIRHNNKN